MNTETNISIYKTRQRQIILHVHIQVPLTEQTPTLQERTRTLDTPINKHNYMTEQIHDKSHEQDDKE